jgi:hypothetical protein
MALIDFRGETIRHSPHATIAMQATIVWYVSNTSNNRGAAITAVERSLTNR